jgi:hypothetical protein
VSGRPHDEEETAELAKTAESRPEGLLYTGLARMRCVQSSAIVLRTSRYGQARAALHSRLTVPAEMSSTSAVSSMVRPPYEAIQMHVESLIEDKQPVPVSTPFAEYAVVPT